MWVAVGGGGTVLLDICSGVCRHPLWIRVRGGIGERDFCDDSVDALSLWPPRAVLIYHYCVIRAIWPFHFISLDTNH